MWMTHVQLLADATKKKKRSITQVQGDPSHTLKKKKPQIKTFSEITSVHYSYTCTHHRP